MLVHGDITPFKALVQKRVLYDMEPLIPEFEYIHCIVFGVSSYPESVPTFQIMVENESIFSYVPPHLLLVNNSFDDNSSLELKDLVYHNCPDVEFTVVVSNYLCRPLYVYLKHRKIWRSGKYLFTIDWYRGNDLLHCIVLENGQIGFFPSHKISFGSTQLPDFKKLRQEWKV
jgi:hypothetical protein